MNEFKIDFYNGTEEIKSIHKQIKEISYNEVNDNLKPEFFRLYLETSISKLIIGYIENYNMVDNQIQIITPQQIAYDIVSKIDIESFRPLIMDQNVGDPYSHSAVILLSKLLLQGLYRYGFDRFVLENIIRLFER